VKSKCDAIVQSLPNDYERTLQAVQDNLTDVQICDVLGSADHVAANKAILNHLTSKVKCVVDILSFCSQLEKITPIDAGAFDRIISDLRSCESTSQYYETGLHKGNFSHTIQGQIQSFEKGVHNLNHIAS